MIALVANIAIVMLLACQANTLSEQKIHVRVMLSGPVQDATVTAWLVEASGGKLSDPVAGRELMISDPTDENGEVTLDLGVVDGIVLLEAAGGRTTDVVYGDGVSDGDVSDGDDGPGQQRDIPIEMGDFRMRTVVGINLRNVLVHERFITISPLTTAATRMARTRLERGQEPNYVDAVDAACKLLDSHVGESIRETQAIFIADPGPHVPEGLTLSPGLPGIINGFVLASFAGLAEHIAASSELSRESITSLDIARALVADASDDAGLLDGKGSDGPVTIVHCSSSQAQELCQVDANTWRADLAGALALYVMPSEHNGTGLGLDDMRSLIDRLQGNNDAGLFGEEPTVSIDFLGPQIDFLPVEIDDELLDLISFTEDSTPIHQATAQVVLGPRQAHAPCPVVYKYASRLNDPDDNPLYWEFIVRPSPVARREWSLDERAQYRVRIDSARWPDEWMEAEVVREEDGGLVFRAVVLEDSYPSISRVSEIFEIQVRGWDHLGQERKATTCWDQRILPIPLDIGEPEEISDSELRSLKARDLQNNNLADMLNGNGWAGIVRFEIKNGTSKRGHVGLRLVQAAMSYSKSWHRTNAFISSDMTGLFPNCIVNATCYLTVPARFSTTLVSGFAGLEEEPAVEIVVFDLSTGERIFPCYACNRRVFDVVPRQAVGLPSRYEVWVIVTDLSFLAPALPDEGEVGPFEDFALDPQRALPLTGVRYERMRICDFRTSEDEIECRVTSDYRHYRALLAASIDIPMINILVGRYLEMSDKDSMFEEYVEYRNYHWETMEGEVPVPYNGSTS